MNLWCNVQNFLQINLWGKVYRVDHLVLGGVPKAGDFIIILKAVGNLIITGWLKLVCPIMNSNNFFVCQDFQVF